MLSLSLILLVWTLFIVVADFPLWVSIVITCCATINFLFNLFVFIFTYRATDRMAKRQQNK